MIEFSNLEKMPKALAKLQAETNNPLKNAKSHNNKYANLEGLLEVVKPTLAENGFSLIQSAYNDNDKLGVETLLLHESGEFIRGRFASNLVEDRLKGSQAVGSQITYFRRYSILAMLNLAAEDDDGAASSGNQQGTQQNNNPDAQAASVKQKEYILDLTQKVMGMEDYHKNLVEIKAKTNKLTRGQARAAIDDLNAKLKAKGSK